MLNRFIFWTVLLIGIYLGTLTQSCKQDTQFAQLAEKVEQEQIKVKKLNEAEWLVITPECNICHPGWWE